MSKELARHLVAIFSRDLPPVPFPYLAAAPMMALLRDHRVPKPDDLIPGNPYLCVPWYLTKKSLAPEGDALEHPIPIDDKWFAPADARRMAKALLAVLDSTWADQMLVRVIAAGLADEARKIIALMEAAEQQGIRFHFTYQPCGQRPADLMEWEGHWLADIQEVIANRTDTRLQPDAIQGASGKDGKGGSLKEAIPPRVSVDCSSPELLHLTFGCDILQEVLSRAGVARWNDLMNRLYARNIVYCVYGPDDIPPVAASLDFRGLVMRGRMLDGIDLRWCELDGADFTGCSLRMARFTSVERVNFEKADLRAALFEGADITGASFRGADVYGMQFCNGMYYYAEEPPKGLPPDMFARCEAWSADHPMRKRLDRKQKCDFERMGVQHEQG